jgi:transcriptional regulator with XRE-family HTH domain
MRDEDPKIAPVPRRKSSDIDVLVGRRIRLRRSLLGLTQADLATKCFLSPQQVHKYERGESKMTAARLDQFSKAMRVPISWFFDDFAEQPQWPEDMLEILSAPLNAKLLTVFDEIKDPKLQQIVLSLAESLAKYGSDTETTKDTETAEIAAEIALLRSFR